MQAAHERQSLGFKQTYIERHKVSDINCSFQRHIKGNATGRCGPPAQRKRTHPPLPASRSPVEAQLRVASLARTSRKPKTQMARSKFRPSASPLSEPKKNKRNKSHYATCMCAKFQSQGQKNARVSATTKPGPTGRRERCRWELEGPKQLGKLS